MATDADIWREALQRKGKDWVLAELHLRPGQPDDVLLDVVYEEPYPTREFCRQWCVEADNQYFRASGTTKWTITALIMFLLFLAMAMYSFQNATTGPGHSHSAMMRRAG